MKFYTSDLHLGHNNIICYTNRPFMLSGRVRPERGEGQCPGDVAAMNLWLVERWNAVVGVDDTVVVLGDLAMGKIDSSLELIAELNGTITLVPGNHDRCWVGNRKDVEGWRERYLKAGITTIADSPEPVMLAGRTVNMCHFPYTGDSHDKDRYAEWRPTDKGGWLLCGHVHNAWRQRARQINVGVDVWAGTPVPETTIADLISAGASDLDALPWEI